MEWGSIAEWVTAVAAVIAAVAGAAALKFNFGLLRSESESLRMLREDRERDQASKVSVWLRKAPPLEAGYK